jgi:hypothetical protein
MQGSKKMVGKIAPERACLLVGKQIPGGCAGGTRSWLALLCRTVWPFRDRNGPRSRTACGKFRQKNIKVASKKSFWIKNAWIWPILDLKAPAANKIA